MPLPRLQFIASFLGRLSSREKLVFYCAVFIISLTMLDRLIIGPVFTKIKVLSQEIEEKELSITKNLKVIAYKDRIEKETKDYSSYLEKFESEEEEVTSLLKTVEGLANKSSIYLIDMKPRGIKDRGTLKEFSISLSGEAQLEQIVDFIYKIENSKRLLTVDKYEITPKAKESSVAHCSMLISKFVLVE